MEGARLIGRAVRAGLAPLEVYTSDSTTPHPEAPIVFTVASPALDRASYRGSAPGIIAVFTQFDCSLDTLDPSRQSLILVAEGIEKPGNLGAMLRTADAVGADALITVGPSVDSFNPNVVQASTGALFSVPLAQTTIGELQTWLTVALVGATPDSAVPLWDQDLTPDVALMVGAEDTGLSVAARRAATSLVSLPMAGIADSLNASTTLAVLAYETIRQRSQIGD